MQLKDAEPGQLVYFEERLGDEFRQVFYVRDPDGECRYPHNVRAGRIGIIQSTREDLVAGTPRYYRFERTECRDPGEVDGRLTVLPLNLEAAAAVTKLRRE